MSTTRDNHIRILFRISMGVNIIFLFLIAVLLNNTSSVSPSNYNVFVKEEAPIIHVKEVEQNTQPVKIETPVAPPSEREVINAHVVKISAMYSNVDPYLVMSIIQHESEYVTTAKNGDCFGLMQITKRWHSDRASKLGVTDFYDPYGNILLGVDYLSELFSKYKDPSLVLMLYNMNHQAAIKAYTKGEISKYAKSVLAKAEVYRKGG